MVALWISIVKLYDKAITKYRREGFSSVGVSLLDLVFGPERLDPLYAAWVKWMGNETSHHGITLDLNFDCIDDRIRARFVRGSYESIERWFVDRYVTGGNDVIDLGGGLGFVACYLDDCLDASDTLAVLEANEELIPVIERTRDLNDASFDLHHGAYAPDGKPVSFQSGNVATAGSVSSSLETNIDSLSLRDLVECHGLEQFNLVADVEGAEYEMLDEDAQVLSSRCSLLIAETHEINGQVPEEFKRTIEEIGFTLLDELDNIVVYKNKALMSDEL